jgi:hypothetical protein
MRIVMLRNYGVMKDGRPWLVKGQEYDSKEVGLSREDEIMILATRKGQISPNTSADEMFNIERTVDQTYEKRTPKPRTRKKANNE